MARTSKSTTQYSTQWILSADWKRTTPVMYGIMRRTYSFESEDWDFCPLRPLSNTCHAGKRCRKSCCHVFWHGCVSRVAAWTNDQVLHNNLSSRARHEKFGNYNCRKINSLNRWQLIILSCYGLLGQTLILEELSLPCTPRVVCCAKKAFSSQILHFFIELFSWSFDVLYRNCIRSDRIPPLFRKSGG